MIVDLIVNNIPIKNIPFVDDFIAKTVMGMVDSLKHNGEVRDIKLSITGGRASINLNGSDLPVNEFVTKIIISTMNGLVSPLKGVTYAIETLDLVIKK
jgi:hypothetical protein